MLILRSVAACAVITIPCTGVADAPHPAGEDTAAAVAPKLSGSHHRGAKQGRSGKRRPQLPRLELGALDLGTLRVSPTTRTSASGSQRVNRGSQRAGKTDPAPTITKRMVRKPNLAPRETPELGSVSFEFFPVTAGRPVTTSLSNESRSGADSPLGWAKGNNEDFMAIGGGNQSLSLGVNAASSPRTTGPLTRDRPSLMFTAPTQPMRLTPVPVDPGVNWIAPPPGASVPR